jgi:serine/threonine-protein kinase
VLERSLALREGRERSVSDGVEGSTIAGKYRVERRMGAGASGVIYEARRASDGRSVAIKLLRSTSAQHAAASDRLRRESEALGLAWHPNVVERLDHGTLPDGTAFLVMELLRGETLASRLRSQGKLSPEAVLQLALPLAEALVAVHAAGVIHRDIKPSNIFLARDAVGREVVKLIDFGIARVEWDELRITQIGALVGTPGYMAPEQESGVDADARSDVFAFGATLFECLTGEAAPPAPSGTFAKTETPSDGVPVAFARVIPAAWMPLLDKAMAPSRELRFQDARALAAALRGLASGGPGSKVATRR